MCSFVWNAPPGMNLQRRGVPLPKKGKIQNGFAFCVQSTRLSMDTVYRDQLSIVDS